MRKTPPCAWNMDCTRRHHCAIDASTTENEVSFCTQLKDLLLSIKYDVQVKSTHNLVLAHDKLLLCAVGRANIVLQAFTAEANRRMLM